MTSDPVHQRRARIARLVSLGQRTGYLLFAIAIVVFVIGAIVDFSDTIVSVIVVCLIVGSIVLAPAIVFGYAVKAADREDTEQGMGRS
ncbi:MAG: hypothetical protein ACR2QE_19915 [Acidimicrobiales bacterium]